jgi:hypothetical protein
MADFATLAPHNLLSKSSAGEHTAQLVAIQKATHPSADQGS